MNFKRERRTRGIRPEIPDAHVEYLFDGNYEGSVEKFLFSGGEEAVRSAWEAIRDELLAEWIGESPGTRPWGWWEHDAPRHDTGTGAYFEPLPVPRRRLGGKGQTTPEKYPAMVPYFDKGIPSSWAEIDPDDPPVFESEASFLKRHGLFIANEEKRIPAYAWEIERVEIEGDEKLEAGYGKKGGMKNGR